MQQLEYEIGELADLELRLEIIHYFKKLLEFEDLNWVDLIVWRLTRERFQLPRTVQELAARVAHARLLGAGSRNEISKVFKEHTRELELTVMSSLIGKWGHKVAANLAAKAVYAVCGYSRLGSTIEGEFPKYASSTPLAAALSTRLQGEAKILEKLEEELAPMKNREGTRR